MSDRVEVAALPMCDVHTYLKGKDDVPAAYDGKTTSGPWANMCQECFDELGVGLGTGLGQRLVVRGEGA
jgi:hypothetical protein